MSYPLDETGTAASNLVVGEQKSVKTIGLGTSLYVFLANALFYSKGFIVQYTDMGGITRTLTKGTDYSFDFMIDGVVSGNPIYGVLKLDNTQLNGTITVQYQTVGGNWAFNKPQVIQFQRENSFNPRLAYYAVVPYPPLLDTDGVSPIVLNSPEALTQAQALANPVMLSIGIVSLDPTQKIFSNGNLLVDGDETPENLTGSMSSGAEGTSVSLSGNIAQETGGNLAEAAALLQTLASVQGMPADAPYTGTGNATMIGALKGVIAALANNLGIRPLSSATDSIKVTGGTGQAIEVDGSSVTQPVSAAALPLPANAAKESGGNLDAIAGATATTATQSTTAATQLTSLNATTGTTGDAAYNGAGASTILAALKGIFAKLGGVLNTRALSNATDSIAATVSGTVTTTSSQLPATLGQKTSAFSVSTTISSDQAPLNVTSTGGALATDASIQSLITAVKNTVTMNGTVWVDATGSTPEYYIRRETYIQQAGAYAITWENLDGSTATPTVTNLTETGGESGITNEQAVYTATAAGTGYAIGDMLIHVYGLNTSASPATLAYAFWFNAGPSVNGTVLTTAPSNSTYTAASSNTSTVEQPDGTKLNATVIVASSVLAANAAQESGGNLAAIAGSTATVAAAQGAAATGTTMPSGGSGLLGWLSGIYTKLSGTLTIGGTVSVSNLPATQAISAAALPLPTGAATETGNLATVATQTTALNTVTGTTADAAWGGAGPSTVIAALKAIYARLTSGVAVTGTFWQATQPVSAASLPLPTGAAKESGGNLDTISTEANAIATATGTTADTAWTGSGSSTMVSALTAIYTRLTAGVAVTGTFWQATQPVSAATLPLPTGAAKESGGNLDSIASSSTTTATETTSIAGSSTTTAAQATALNTVTGTVADTAWTGTGNGTVNAILKAIYAKVAGTLEVSVGNFPSTQAISGSVSVLGGNAAAVKTDGSAVTQPVSVTTLPLPTGAAKESGGNLDAINTSTTTTATQATTTATQVTAINTVQGAVADTAWTGAGSGTVVAILKAIYGKVAATLTVSGTVTANVQGGNTAAVKVDGSAVTQPVSGTVTIQGGNTSSVKTDGSATTQPVSGTFWQATQPVSAAALPLPAGAAKESGGNLDTITAQTTTTATQVTALNTVQGTVADAVYGGSGSGSVIAILKGLYAKLAGTLTVGGTVSLGAGAAAIGSVSVSNFPATQPISATALPLPSGAAKESGGNLDSITASNTTTATQTTAINAVQGTAADTAWSGSGSGSVVSILKALYGALAGGIGVTGTFWQATQPVSAASLPLPSNAAKESGGNLDAIDTATTFIATAQGAGGTGIAQPTGGSGLMGWLSGIYNAVTGLVSVQLSDGTHTAALTPLGSTNALSVMVVDASGNQITSFGGSGGGSGGTFTDAAVGAVGAAAPTSADQVGYTVSATGDLQAAGDTTSTALPVRVLANPATAQIRLSAAGMPKTSFETIVASYKMSAGEIASDFTPNAFSAGYYAGNGSLGLGTTGTTLFSGAASNSGVTLQSHAYFSDIPGQGTIVRYGIDLGDAGTVGAVREWGRATPTDGVFFRLQDLTLYLVIRSNGTEMTIAASTWNTPYTIDANSHCWTIQSQWNSSGIIYIYVDDVLLHTYDYRGTNNGGFGQSTPDIPLWFKCYNTTNTTNINMCVDSVAFSTEGAPRQWTRQLDGDEPSMAVAISPLTPVNISQENAVVTGGTDKYGGIHKHKVSPDGGVLLGDDNSIAPILFGALGQSFILDTTGYQTVSLEISGTFSGTVTVTWSNEGETYTGALAVGIGGAAATNVISAAGIWPFTAAARYMKLSMTGYMSGIMQIVPILRNVPLGGLITNITHIAGSAPTNIGVGGGFLVGGNAGVGASSAVLPIRVGGVDLSGLNRIPIYDVNGYAMQMGSLPVGYVPGTYNVKYGKYTQALASLTAAQSASQPLVAGAVDQAGRVQYATMDQNAGLNVQLPNQQGDQRSLTDLMTEMVSWQRVVSYYLFEMLCNDANRRLSDEEPETLLQTFLQTTLQGNNQPS